MSTKSKRSDDDPVPTFQDLADQNKQRKISDASEINKALGYLNSTIDEENTTKKVKYPKSVFFIVSNEFCERFSYYGLRTILSIYLMYELKYSSDTSTVIYHTFIMFCYFFPLLGAIIADSWLGKFNTIFYLSIVYAIGNIVVSGGAFPAIDLTSSRVMTLIGLILIACGTGGIKPCVSAFGGDQFVLPQQESHLKKFFSLFYFSINAGSLISTFLTPVLREDVKCFNEDSCYSLAFGVPAILMIVSLIIFLLGKKWYTIKKPEGNIMVKLFKCIGHAIKRRKEKRDHWLDRADDEFDQDFIDGVKATLRVLLLFVPLPVFWALFDQQGSRWTFQAARMTGKFPGFTLKPDQMQVVNPLLILLFIPIFETLVYPLFAKCNFLVRPLQRLVVGGLLAAIAFFISAGVETYLEPTYAILPEPGIGQLRLHNGLNCEVIVSIPGIKENDKLEPLGLLNYTGIELTDQKEYEMRFSSCNGNGNGRVTVEENKANSYFIRYDLTLSEGEDENVDKSDNGDPKVKVLLSGVGSADTNITLFQSDTVSTLFDIDQNGISNYTKLESGDYKVKMSDGREVGDITLVFEQGGVYAVIVYDDGVTLNASSSTVTQPNTVNMLWLIPQYVVITAGEVMFSITGLEFAFTQAPVSMKSVMTSCWHLTVAFGNLIVIIIAEAKLFSSQTYEFLLFAVLMVVDMVIFALMAMRYTYVDFSNKGDNHESKAKEEDTDSPSELNGNMIPMKDKY